MPRRWHHVLKKLTLLRGNGGNKARSPGRARSKPLKPFAQGRPGISGEPVVTNLRVFYLYTQGRGLIRSPAFPAPSPIEGDAWQNSGDHAAGTHRCAHLALFTRAPRGPIIGPKTRKIHDPRLFA